MASSLLNFICNQDLNAQDITNQRSPVQTCRRGIRGGELNEGRAGTLCASGGIRGGEMNGKFAKTFANSKNTYLCNAQTFRTYRIGCFEHYDSWAFLVGK
jgi:hypothetical protein